MNEIQQRHAQATRLKDLTVGFLEIAEDLTTAFTNYANALHAPLTEQDVNDGLQIGAICTHVPLAIHLLATASLALAKRMAEVTHGG